MVSKRWLVMVIVANNRHKHEKTFVSSEGTGSFSRGNCFDFTLKMFLMKILYNQSACIHGYCQSFATMSILGVPKIP